MYKIKFVFNERQVRSKLRKIIFTKGRLKCPHCSSFIIKRIKSEDRYYCKRCRRKFSLLSNTWMKDIKIPLPIFILLLQLWLEEYSIKNIKKLTKLSTPTIRRYFVLFRANIVNIADFSPKINVQVDEAYFGRLKKANNYYHGWRTFRTQEKVCVAGISCPVTGTLATKVIDKPKGRPIRQFIYNTVPTNIHIYSDGSYIYTNLKKHYSHTSQTHDLGFHNAYYIESCWSWMKRKLFIQYHHFHRKNAEDYVSELTWRFNIRNEPKNPFDYIKDSL